MPVVTRARKRQSTLSGFIAKPTTRQARQGSLLVKLQVPAAHLRLLDGQALLSLPIMTLQTTANSEERPPIDPTMHQSIEVSTADTSYTLVDEIVGVIPKEDTDMLDSEATLEPSTTSTDNSTTGCAMDNNVTASRATKRLKIDPEAGGQVLASVSETTSADVKANVKAEDKANVMGEQMTVEPSDRKSLEAVFNKMMAPLRGPIVNKPLPRGAPPVWSNTRQALNETCSYFRSYQGGSYGDSEGMRGMMFDAESDEFDLADSQVVIARGGGGRDVGDDKKRIQAKDQEENWAVKSMRKNIDNQEPVAIILGDRYSRTLTRLPHVYNVLDWFKITDVWWSKINGKRVVRYRFEKHNPEKPSWWVPEGHVEEFPLGSLHQDASTRRTCAKCDSTWDQVYTCGWMCLNQHCTVFWKVATAGPFMREPPATGLKYDPRFLNKKTVWLSTHDPEPLVAERGVLEDTQNSMNVLRHGSKGMVCPRCSACVRRLRMTGAAWACDTPRCGFKVEVAPMSLRLNWVLDYERPVSRDIVPRNRDALHAHYARFFGQRQFYNGGYKVLRYDLLDTDCFVVHLIPNGAPLKAEMGANELFNVMQEANLPLVRRALACAPTRGEMVTNHYTLNIGMPYKFVATADSASFEDVPPALSHARTMLNYYNKLSVGEDLYEESNEMLVLGYLEGNKIGFHDDGETGLGPTISTLSLGAPSYFNIRMKEKHLTSSGIKLPEKGKKAVWLSMQCGHGDIVIMHGRWLQKAFEHEVVPLGTFRYALTCRTIDLESLRPTECPDYPVKPDTGVYTPAYTAPVGTVVPEWWHVPAAAGPASSSQ